MPTKEMLYSLIDDMDTNDYELVFHFLERLVPTKSKPLPDELELINGLDDTRDSIPDDEIDWDNLDSMDLD